MNRPRVGLLFDYDWDAAGFARLGSAFHFSRDGFDLFSFPSNARLAWFDMQRDAARLARRGQREGWSGVLSHHEQFGALLAALVAERLGLPGTAPEAVLACQHKLHARQVLQQVAPEANLAFAELPVRYGEPIPDGLAYPAFVKPVKAAFSVLAKRVRHRDELQAHTRFGAWELWVIRHLVEPFERIAAQRLPQAGSAHRLMLEEPLHAAQYNLDGWVHEGQVHLLGVVDAIMYPGTQAFMRFDAPSRLPAAVQQRALDVARRFLSAVGFTHGFFNMEFFHDATTDRLAVIEFNPRLASQLADLYRRVQGVDAHAMSVALAQGRDPLTVPRTEPHAGAASSFVYRAFDEAAVPPQPGLRRRHQALAAFDDALLLPFPKSGSSLQRDFKWLDSHRYAVLHLGGRDEHDLRERCIALSTALGWTAPYADLVAEAARQPGWAAPAARGVSSP